MSLSQWNLIFFVIVLEVDETIFFSRLFSWSMSANASAKRCDSFPKEIFMRSNAFEFNKTRSKYENTWLSSEIIPFNQKTEEEFSFLFSVSTNHWRISLVTSGSSTTIAQWRSSVGIRWYSTNTQFKSITEWIFHSWSSIRHPIRRTFTHHSHGRKVCLLFASNFR